MIGHHYILVRYCFGSYLLSLSENGKSKEQQSGKWPFLLNATDNLMHPFPAKNVSNSYLDEQNE